MADVIEPCSNTSRLEVITDVTMIRSSMAPCCGAELYTHHVKCNQRVIQKRKRQEGCVRSAGTQMGRFPPHRARPVWGRSLNETLTFMLFSRLHVFLWLSPPPCMWVTLREKTFNHCSTSNHLCPLGHQPATNGRVVRKKKSKLPIGPDSGSHFHCIFFAGGGRLATAETQSLALSSAYSKALTPLSTLHYLSPGEAGGSDWSGVERAALNLDFLFPGTSLLRGMSAVRCHCLSNRPTLKWQSGTGWWWNWRYWSRIFFLYVIVINPLIYLWVD